VEPFVRSAELRLRHESYDEDGRGSSRAFGLRVAGARPAYDIVGVQEYDNATDADYATASGCDDGGERIDYIVVPTDPALTSSRYVVTVATRADVDVVRWSAGRGTLAPGLGPPIEIRER
jgi:hypothetical protein